MFTFVSMYSDFIIKLKRRLGEKLPGESVQYKMAPAIRKPPPAEFFKKILPKPSGVLILIYPKLGKLHIVLMLRPSYNGMHSGQVSFPGGKQEDEDKNIFETALREAKEEVGIDPEQTELLGQITNLYVQPSNFCITPVVAYTPQQPDFTIDPQEVDELIEVSLETITNPAIIKTKMIRLADGFEIETPYYDVNGKVVWGATAMILSEFIQIVYEIQN